MALKPTQKSITRGDAAKWMVGVWTANGKVPDVTVHLTATPASSKPAFSVGCGSGDGTGSCDLETVDSNSAPRQLEAQVAIPATATSVTSVDLTAVASAPHLVNAHLAKDPQASAAVTVTAPAPSPSPSPSRSHAASNSTGTGSAGIGTSATPPPPTGAVTSQLPVGNLPYLNGTGSTLSPGGNASGLFPTLSPSSSSTASTGIAGSGNPSGSFPPSPPAARARARPLANTSALPGGTSVIGAQLVGLIALAVAFVLTVTRLSIRKRPAPPNGPGGKSQ